MYICTIRSQTIYHPNSNSPSKSYTALRILTTANWEPGELLSRSNDEVFVCPKAFKQYFRRHVERTVKQRRLAGKEIGTLSETTSHQLTLVLFAQLSAAVVCHKANDGVEYAIRAWFKYDTTVWSGITISSYYMVLAYPAQQCFNYC